MCACAPVQAVEKLIEAVPAFRAGVTGEIEAELGIGPGDGAFAHAAKKSPPVFRPRVSGDDGEPSAEFGNPDLRRRSLWDGTLGKGTAYIPDRIPLRGGTGRTGSGHGLRHRERDRHSLQKGVPAARRHQEPGANGVTRSKDMSRDPRRRRPCCASPRFHRLRPGRQRPWNWSRRRNPNPSGPRYWRR